MKYIKQLDSLRALAILSVLCNHTLPADHFLYKVSGFIEAPDIFFAISGFLITIILLKARNAVEARRTSKLIVLRNFFAKRILRIFPAYYLTLIITYFVSISNIIPYRNYVTFTANLAIYHLKSWGDLGHLWSMSVEQQFYLLWPFVIIFTPRKLLLVSISLFIAIGIYSRQVLPANDFTLVLPQTCFDALGWGAVLAWAITHNYQSIGRIYTIASVAALASVVLLAAEAVYGIEILITHHRTFLAIITAWLITYFIYYEKQNGGSLGKLFNNKALLLIGKMSYGIYLYHLPILSDGYKLLDQLNAHLPFYTHFNSTQVQTLTITEDFIIIFLLAWFSWKYFELPLYSLSRYFADSRKSVIGEAQPVQALAPL